ncbi:hypothetical protein QYF36_000170 [Acer negundo]|nr:hypothetical protein QYF36_000170 [Acer negundo]
MIHNQNSLKHDRGSQEDEVVILVSNRNSPIGNKSLLSIFNRTAGASLLPDISFACTLEELFVSLERMMIGFPLPSNVITDINPYIYMPLNLPGQVSHEHKTDWVMQEFSITRKRVCESTKFEDSSLLCRVLLSAEQTPNSENQQILLIQAKIPQAIPRYVSILVALVKDDDEKTELAVLERPANNHVPYLPDSDYISRGDFLELLDLLDEPSSPSSSSETSSCVTTSSDDFFDPEDCLKELESNNNQDEVQDNVG